MIRTSVLSNGGLDFYLYYDNKIKRQLYTTLHRIKLANVFTLPLVVVLAAKSRLPPPPCLGGGFGRNLHGDTALDYHSCKIVFNHLFFMI